MGASVADDDRRPRNLDPFEDLVSDISSPGFRSYQVNHPSGLVGVHRGTHLSVYARSHQDPEGEPTNLVARVLFDRIPRDRAGRQGWPSTMDAVEALDDTAKRLGRSGFVPDL